MNDENVHKTLYKEESNSLPMEITKLYENTHVQEKLVEIKNNQTLTPKQQCLLFLFIFVLFFVFQNSMLLLLFRLTSKISLILNIYGI